MTKSKTPLFGLEAHGTIADSVTFQRRNRTTFARSKPIPSDPKSLAQIYHRWDYQDYAQYWRSLTPAQKQQWESTARRLRITGFNLWMRTYLNTLPDLAARWHLDKLIGSLVLDSSENTNNGTVVGATLVDGFIDHALEFDGIDDYVNIPAHSTLDLTELITLEARVYIKTIKQSDIITRWQWAAGAVKKGYTLFLGSNGTPRFYVGTNTGWNSILGSVLQPNRWHHLLGTHDGTFLRLYANGEQDAAPVAATQVPWNSATYSVRLGYQAWGRFHGVIDEARIYNRALIDQEAKIHSERRYPV